MLVLWSHVQVPLFILSRKLWLALLASVCLVSHAEQTKNQPKKLNVPPTTISVSELQMMGTIEPTNWENTGVVSNNHSDELSRLKLIDEFDCLMHPGRGNASNLAALIAPYESGARVFIVGQDGVLFEDDLPFEPDFARIGKHEDGSVVAGFGDMSVGSSNVHPRDHNETARIYINDRIVYENTNIWNFDVAQNGSSFAVHEAISDRGSRLLVADIDGKKAFYHQLGNDVTPWDGYEPGCRLSYSKQQTEVQIWCAQSDPKGKGIYHFFPLEGNNIRRVLIDDGWNALLTSSELGYFVNMPDEDMAKEFGDVWKVSRRELNFESGLVENVWSKHVFVDTYGGSLEISDNGKWLIVNGYRVNVLDAKSGDILFEFPTVRDKQTQLERLANVLPKNATISDLGRLGGVGFAGDRLYFYRTYGSNRSCNRVIHEKSDRIESKKCERELRKSGLYRVVHDIYEMEDIQLESLPSYRADLIRETSCNRATPTYRGLFEVNGRLVFRQPKMYFKK